jgi:hypothetical protein
MNWRLFGQIALLIVFFFGVYLALLMVRDSQSRDLYRERLEEVRKQTDDRIKAEQAMPPYADPELMNTTLGQ